MVSKVVSLFARITRIGAAALGVVALTAPAAKAAPGPAPSAPPTTTTHHAASHHGSPSHPRPARHAGAITLKHAKDTSSPASAERAHPKEAVAKDPPPKQSLTPLPTIAAAMGTPLAAPISTQVTSEARGKRGHAKDDLGHGAEPRRTPILVSTHTSASTATKKAAAAPAGKPPCLRDAIDFMRGTEEEKLTLTKCDGSVAPLAVEGLSVLVRPGSAAKPAEALKDLAKKSGADIAPGIKRLDARLVERLQAMVDHFARTAKPGVSPKVYFVSGYRPLSAGSFHATGRALDFRIDGVKNDELVQFCKTLPDTGCGYYPNSSFIHLDVREAGTGHVSWIDASGPGETPKYVASWPPPPDGTTDGRDDEDTSAQAAHLLAKLDSELSLLPAPPGESKPDNGTKSDLSAKVHDDAPPAAMLEKEIGESDRP